MSDKERFIAFLKSIRFEEVPVAPYGAPHDAKYAVGEYEDGGSYVEIGNFGDDGYCSFFSRWSFDKDGVLLSVGHLE